jgi:glycosyltransferase involved in cell wall biosynthesis
MITDLQRHERSSQLETSPLVSVIINNYNYGRFVAKAIDSVLEQTYKNVELIVVDDGSTDNSRQVIESYGDRLIAIFQENSGQGTALNAGIARAKGEIICFLDADDFFHPEKIARVVATFAEHPEWVQLGHCWTSVDAEGVPIGSSTSSILNQGDVRNLLLQWGRYATAITSALAYRRTVLQQVLPIPTQRTEAADTYLTATVPFYGEVGSINEPLMFYRIHGKNRQAHSGNWSRMLHQRELTAAYVDRAAATVGLVERSNLQQDVDYRSFKAIEQGKGSWIGALQVAWLSWQESQAIGRSMKDTLVRLVFRSTCTLLPQQGILLLRYGLRGYVRWKFLGQAPKT